MPDLERVRSSPEEPLTLTETKNYLRIPDTEKGDDNLVWQLVKAVRESAEAYLKTSIMDQIWRLAYHTYAPRTVKLLMGPVQRIDSVYVSGRYAGSTTLITPDLYYLNAGKNKLIFHAYIIGHRIQISYVTGYGEHHSDVPDSIRQGLLSHIADIYEGRSGANIIPGRSQELYNPYKQVG